MFKIKNTRENQKTIETIMNDNIGVILNKKMTDDYIIFDILNNDPLFASRFSNGATIKSWLEIIEKIDSL